MSQNCFEIYDKLREIGIGHKSSLRYAEILDRVLYDLSNDNTSLNHIFQEITSERKRQDELHPWDKLDISLEAIEHSKHLKKSSILKKANNLFEKKIQTMYLDLTIEEEYHEIFSETDPIRQEAEAIQLAALAIKFVQWSRAKRAKEG